MCVRLIFTSETELGVLVTDLLFKLWLLPGLTVLSLFLHSLLPQTLTARAYSLFHMEGPRRSQCISIASFPDEQ